MTRTLWTLSAILAVACGGPLVPPPTGAPAGGGAPSDPASGGGGTGAGTAPDGGGFPAGLSLSGTIETTEGVLGGAEVNAFVETTSGYGYSYWYAHGETVADGAGHFLLSELPESATVLLQVFAQGYVQQCASPPVKMVANAQLNVEMISASRIFASPDSLPTPAAGFRSISGRILQPMAKDTEPAAGALVDFEPVMDFPAAMTAAAADGKYALCGIPDGETVEICAWKGPMASCVLVPAGQSEGVDITLPGPDDAG